MDEIEPRSTLRRRCTEQSTSSRVAGTTWASTVATQDVRVRVALADSD